ncbi:ABC transporter ATP-binding protein [Rhizobacter sp. AJA081-3]|jgi:branched-chain amino acid transport system ATP-binding protein|uniref:ABC transporter ATP-binding protein n=1 Tax=Rhizobacter sp. AJA081-3 TaxID=2753607 RepID=UPI001ADF3DAD|nr:ABC transporter ATP-binding protein [Rhizobacter sp. AJA081-3]MCL4697620.1 ABC transporter ATP-binding protein [Burkholderiaceae bacterium]QTN22171.1 ABC transporter ATP-binding protein [Rhizobacter sp. AJA081-3]HOX69762.1 ABC transporter ATP-binding protein [Burkholderiaceae bacterium]
MNGDTILNVRGLTVRFGTLVAVSDVSFDAQRGHITSVIGPNGAGKSSLFNLISGAIRPSAGQVLFEGRDMTGQRPDKMLAAGLARSFQITNLFFELPVRENLRLAAQFVENGRGLFRGIAASRVALARVDELIERFALQTRADELAGFLSHGEQRRLEIAVALAARPRLLLLDEPTQGMSHADTQDTEALIRSLAAEGLSLLLVEHDVELVMNLSDHVVVMHQGAKLAEGPPLQVRADPAVQAAYFGDAREASHA